MAVFMDAAVKLAAEGRRIVQLAPGTKRPMHREWPKVATSDIAVIERL